MKLVSVTLLGDGREGTICNTVASVHDLVDEVIILDTRKANDDAIGNVATLDCSLPVQKVRVIKYDWPDDFSEARNAALTYAYDRGADWALVLDSDETLVTGGVDIRKYLDWDESMRRGGNTGPGPAHLTLRSSDGVYQQPRFFRLPVQGKFVGPTHEEFRPHQPSHVLEGVTFASPPKTPGQAITAAERDLPILERYTEEHPEDARFWYYLGAAQQVLGHYVDAVDSFRIRADLTYGEEAAWSCFRAAVCFLQLKCPQEALTEATAGMERHAGLPELAWVAGLACLESKRWDQALIWGAVARDVGKLETLRVGQKSLVSHYEGPHEVMMRAFQALGRFDLAEAERIRADIARKYREALGS